MDQEMERGASLIEKTIERIGVDSAFGAPIKEGKETIIPVASVIYGFGFGSGYGLPDGKEGKKTAATAGGSGGGVGGQTKPMGYIRLGAGEPQFVPAFNPGVVALAGILLSAWSVFWITKTVRAFLKR
jgi:uncharacterized spore protein YtfJ